MLHTIEFIDSRVNIENKKNRCRLCKIACQKLATWNSRVCPSSCFAAHLPRPTEHTQHIIPAYLSPPGVSAATKHCMWMCKLRLHTVNNTDLTDACYWPLSCAKLGLIGRVPSASEMVITQPCDWLPILGLSSWITNLTDTFSY